MDFTCQYCSTRRDIEERSWALVSRLCSLTSRLTMLVGQRTAFSAVKVECGELRQEIQHLHVRLKDHRDTHHC